MEELSCAASNFHRSSEYFCFTPVICKTNVPDVVCFLWFSFSFFFLLKSFNRPEWFRLKFYCLRCFISSRAKKNDFFLRNKVICVARFQSVKT